MDKSHHQPPACGRTKTPPSIPILSPLRVSDDGRLVQTRFCLSRNQSRQGSGFWLLKNGLSIDAYLLVRPEVPDEKTDYTTAQYFP